MLFSLTCCLTGSVLLNRFKTNPWFGSGQVKGMDTRNEIVEMFQTKTRYQDWNHRLTCPELCFCGPVLAELCENLDLYCSINISSLS